MPAPHVLYAYIFAQLVIATTVNLLVYALPPEDDASTKGDQAQLELLQTIDRPSLPGKDAGSSYRAVRCVNYYGLVASCELRRTSVYKVSPFRRKDALHYLEYGTTTNTDEVVTETRVRLQMEHRHLEGH